MIDRRTALLGLVAATGAVLPASANADHLDWPVRPVTMICPYPPAGGSDLLLRAFAGVLASKTRQRIDVVNISGGGGGDGHSAVMRATPDGYTLGMITFVVSSLHQQGLIPFTWRDFDALMRINADHPALTVHADAPFRSVGDFVAHAKQNPGAVSIGHTGPGSAWHIAAALMAKTLGFTARYVPFDGSAPALEALLARQVTAVSVSAPEVRREVEAGRFRILGVMNDKRSSLFPDVPTFGEQGAPTTPFPVWRGIALPKGVPPHIRGHVVAALRSVMESPEFRKAAEDLGLGLAYLDEAAFQAFLEEHYQQVGDLMRSLGIVRK